MIEHKSIYISVKELADLMEANIRTIRRKIEQKKLKATKVKGNYKILKSDALDWLERENLIMEDSDEKDM